MPTYIKAKKKPSVVFMELLHIIGKTIYYIHMYLCAYVCGLLESYGFFVASWNLGQSRSCKEQAATPTHIFAYADRHSFCNNADSWHRDPPTGLNCITCISMGFHSILLGAPSATYVTLNVTRDSLKRANSAQSRKQGKRLKAAANIVEQVANANRGRQKYFST